MRGLDAAMNRRLATLPPLKGERSGPGGYDGDGRLETRRRVMPPTIGSSRSAPVSASLSAACVEKPKDHEDDHGTDECDQHRAENRVPDDRDAPVEDAGQKTAYQRTHNACNNVTHKSKAMAQGQVAGEESGHQADEDPEQNGVEIEVENHLYQASFAAITRADGPLPGVVYRDVKVGRLRRSGETWSPAARNTARRTPRTTPTGPGRRPESEKW